MKQITITAKDVVFKGFKPEDRPATKEEALAFLRHFYHAARKVIEGHP